MLVTTKTTTTTTFTCYCLLQSAARVSKFHQFGFPLIIPTNLTRRRLFSIRIPVMGSVKKGKFVNSCDSHKDISKENGVESKLGDIDPAKLKSMSVQELRTALRNAGAPIKGRKEELVAALRAILDGGFDGINPSACENQSSQEHLLKINSSMTSEEENVRIKESVQGSNLQRSKRLNKRLVDEDVEENNNSQAVNQSTAVETSGKKRSIKRKVVDTVSIQVEISQGVDDSAYGKEPWMRFAHKKPQKGWVAYNPRTMRPPLIRDADVVKLMSWNVNGIRALMKFEGFSAIQLAQREDFDILCLQETKIQEKDVSKVKDILEGYENSFWTCSTAKAGYSGTAIISRIKPLSVKFGLGISEHDTEGRLVTAEFDSFYLLCAYVPNSGDGLKRLDYRTTQWDPSLSQYMKELEKLKPVILTGDLNCAHEEIDIYDPAGNKRSAGFTIEERESFQKNFLSNGFVDTFRKQHPDVVGYTYWGYRSGARKTNRGWRLDYFLVSESIAENAYDSYILPDVNGSDHCPIGLVLKQKP